MSWGCKMTKSEATKSLINIFKKVMIFVTPVCVVSAAVEYIFNQNKIYTIISVIISIFIIYIIWIELRLRKIEEKIK